MKSHPVGSNGQNHIIVPTPVKFLPKIEFQKAQKSIDTKENSISKKCFTQSAANMIERKKQALALKNEGNAAIKRQEFEKAEKYYSEALELNSASRPIWTNRAACRNIMGKHQEAIYDCEHALSIDPKCSRSITQKGNALLGLEKFAEAKQCYESLRSLNNNSLANDLLKKLQDIQEMITAVFESLKHMR